ncbi:nucleotide-binding alpha-beta plait domain-containing protein [Tanacetum coccineum]
MPSSPSEQKILPNTTKTKIALSLGQVLLSFLASEMSSLEEPLGLEKLPSLSDIDLSRIFSSKRCSNSGDDSGLGYCRIDRKTCRSLNSIIKSIGDIWVGTSDFNVVIEVSFEQSTKPSNDEDVPQVNRVHVAGLAKDWNEEKVKEICDKYGEIVNIDLHQSSKPKHKDFGFAVKVNPPRVPLINLIAYKSSADISGSSCVILSCPFLESTDADHVRGSSHTPVDLKDEWRNM